MNIKLASVLVLSLNILTGCMNNSTPAPIEYGGNSSSSPYSSNDSGEIIETPIVHETVKWGDKASQNVPPAEPTQEPVILQEQQVSPQELCSSAPAEHEVIEGETLDTIADKYCVEKASIIKANKLKTPYRVEELQILHIPAKKAHMDSEDSVLPLSAPNTPPPASLRATSHLPVQGTILSKFGEMHDGVANNGVNIAATLGDDIHSLSSGSVVFAGQDPKFGNLVIIKSKDKEIFMAYAYMSDLLLNKGDTVVENQVIGHVGQTGNATSPQLHFAIRQGNTPIDPLAYLGISQ